MEHLEKAAPKPETESFVPLSLEERDKLTPHEKMMYSYEHDIAKLEDDIRGAEAEIEILYDMAFTVDKNEMNEEKKEEFTKKLSALKRFNRGGPGADVFVNALLRLKTTEGEENPFGGNINTLNEYIEGWKKEIENQKKEQREYLDEKYSTNK